MNLIGKNVVYVGGFGGIGLACCAELLKRGINTLIILDVNENSPKLQQLSKLSPNASVEFMPLNLLNGRVTIERILKTVVHKIRYIDILINGSGILNDRKPQLCVDINLTGLIETTLVAVPLMSKSETGRGGLIINIASVLGLEPGPFAAVYSATKHGVIGFTRALADPHYNNITGISFIAICPGATITNLLDTFVGVDTFEISKPLSERIIQAKNQTPEECAEAMMQAVEKAENGSVWICDLGKCEKVEMQKYWSYAFD